MRGNPFVMGSGTAVLSTTSRRGWVIIYCVGQTFSKAVSNPQVLGDCTPVATGFNLPFPKNVAIIVEQCSGLFDISAIPLLPYELFNKFG
jgi:hypothetical protein